MSHQHNQMTMTMQGVSVCDLMSRSPKSQERFQFNRTSLTKQSSNRLPTALLRLNSTGEITSSSLNNHIPSVTVPSNSKPVPINTIIQSGAPCSSYTPCDTSRQLSAKTSDQRKWFAPRTSPVKMLARPQLHSTPIFMKSKSFPEVSTQSQSPFTVEGIQSNQWYNSTLSDRLSGEQMYDKKPLNHSNSTPNMKGEQRLDGSLSAPSLIIKRDFPEPLKSIVDLSHRQHKVGKMHESSSNQLFTSPDLADKPVNCVVNEKDVIEKKIPSSSDVPSPVSMHGKTAFHENPESILHRKQSKHESCSPSEHSVDSFEHTSWTSPKSTDSTLDEGDDRLSDATVDNASEKRKDGQENDRSFVLFRERKCTKKGRPSRKKQRKRYREKLNVKQSPVSDSNESSVVFSITVNEEGDECDNKFKKLHVSLNSNDSVCLLDNPTAGTNQQSAQSDLDISFSSTYGTGLSSESFNEVNSSPSKSAQSSLACIFISGSNVGSDDESDDDDDYDSDSWSSDESMDEPANVSGNFSGLGLALSLDTLFKKKEMPSLKSVLQESEGDNTSGFSSSSPNSLTLLVGSPSNSSIEDSICFSSLHESDSFVELTPSSPAAHSVLGALAEFSQGLCLDSILTGGGVSMTASQPALKASPKESESQRRLREINTTWNEHYHYQTNGDSYCEPHNHIIDRATKSKVCFVEGSGLVTVYEVGTEERRGQWENFVRDRQRFARRVQELSSTLGPILDMAHREKMQERNAVLSENNSEE